MSRWHDRRCLWGKARPSAYCKEHDQIGILPDPTNDGAFPELVVRLRQQESNAWLIASASEPGFFYLAFVDLLPSKRDLQTGGNAVVESATPNGAKKAVEQFNKRFLSL